MNYFQVNVNYNRQTGEDNPGRVKETFLVEGAQTCGDAEKTVMDEIKPFIFGECKTPKIQRRQFFDKFNDTTHDSFYYEAKVEIITIDGDKEVRKAVLILVSADNMNCALFCLETSLESYNCEIISIKKTGITDILSVEKSE